MSKGVVVKDRDEGDEKLQEEKPKHKHPLNLIPKKERCRTRVTVIRSKGDCPVHGTWILVR